MRDSTWLISRTQVSRFSAITRRLLSGQQGQRKIWETGAAREAIIDLATSTASIQSGFRKA